MFCPPFLDSVALVLVLGLVHRLSLVLVDRLTLGLLQTKDVQVKETVSQDVHVKGTVSQDIHVKGTVSQDVHVKGTVTQDVHVNGTVSQNSC